MRILLVRGVSVRVDGGGSSVSCWSAAISPGSSSASPGCPALATASSGPGSRRDGGQRAQDPRAADDRCVTSCSPPGGREQPLASAGYQSSLKCALSLSAMAGSTTELAEITYSPISRILDIRTWDSTPHSLAI